MYQTGRTVPLNILVILMSHQTPFSPRSVDDSISAMGIRNAFKLILVTEGGIVLPRPLKAPPVTDSVHIKSWDKPRIFR